MLDDLKGIHERDAQDALGIAEKQWQQLEHHFEAPAPLRDYRNIVYAGMGSSALAAQFSLSWPGYDVPFEIARDYDIPSYVSENTLFIAASFSGNTEETLSALAQAEERGAQIAVITAGGALANIARTKHYPLIVLPKVEQPRFALLYNLKALLVLAAPYQVTELEKQAAFVRTTTANWAPTVPTAKNLAKQLALEVIGRSVVVYSGPYLSPAAYKWKIGFNENAKQVAWCNTIPEFNHNEFMGWTKQPVQKPYAVIDLRSSLDHERVQKRFALSERLLSGVRPAPHVVPVQGETKLEQLLWASALGDFVTIYTGLLNGLNPMPVALVDKFKKLMEE